MIKGAIFDLDGTLLDSMPIWTDIGARYLRKLGFEPDEKFYDDVRFMKIPDYARYFNERYGLHEDSFELKLKINDMMEYYYLNEFKLKSGVREFLALLKQKGVKLAVSTATDAYLVKAVLTREGVYDEFDALFSCRDHNTSKDEPKIYDLALDAIGTPRSETFIFEDALYAMRTAVRAGYPLCAVYDYAARFDEPEIRKLANVYMNSFWEGETLFFKTS